MTFLPIFTWKRTVTLSALGTINLNIPSDVARDANHLMLLVEAKDDAAVSAATNARLSFNSDGASNAKYDNVLIITDALMALLNTSEDGVNKDFAVFRIPDNGVADADQFGYGIIWIINAFSTTRNKGFTGDGFAQASGASNQTQAWNLGGHYNDTLTAISSIQIKGNGGGDLVAGSRLTAYGVL